jgi:Fe-S oxidoreductase
MSASLERGINAFKEQIDAPVAAFFSSCVRCGLCAEACLFFTETGVPERTPIYKLEPLRRIWKQEYTFWGKLAKSLGLGKPVTDAELTDWETLVYDSCTLCGRCSMVCPVGNDITYMIRKMREGMAAAGHAPEGLIGATKRAVTIGSPMGVKLPALQAQSSMEIMNFPEFISAIARIFKHANVSWTISSEAFEATNSGIQIGVSEIAAELVERVVAAAARLKVKAVISPECGHAYMAIRWEGPNLIGRGNSLGRAESDRAALRFQSGAYSRTAGRVAAAGAPAHHRHGDATADLSRPLPGCPARRRGTAAAQPAA